MTDAKTNLELFKKDAKAACCKHGVFLPKWDKKKRYQHSLRRPIFALCWPGSILWGKGA